MTDRSVATAGGARTLFQKIWDEHVVTQEPGGPAVLYIDAHLVHEVTSPQAFSALRAAGLHVRRPDQTLATMDHSTPTRTLAWPAPTKRPCGRSTSWSRTAGISAFPCTRWTARHAASCT